MMHTATPAPVIRKGDVLHVCAPSSWLQEARFEAGITFLEKAGYRLKIHPQVSARHYQSAGTLDTRAEALMACYADTESKAILTAAGGHRALHLLAHLDMALIRKSGKPLIGFSDTTALLNGLYAQTGVTNFHGPSLASFADGLDEASLNTFEAVLAGENHTYSGFEAAQLLNPETANRAPVQGRLLGGNMCLMQNLIGTPYLPDMQDALLFLEDDGEEIRNLDRMFLHLKNAGILKKVRALILGDFTNTQDSETARGPFIESLDALMKEHFGTLSIPVLTGAPFGHGKALTTFPVGAQALLNTSSAPRLTLI